MKSPLEWATIESQCEAKSPYEVNTYEDRIFKVVGAFRPSRMIEVGVGRGESSEAIVRAMLSYGDAKLISIDPGEGTLATMRVVPRVSREPEKNVVWHFYRWLPTDAIQQIGWDDIDLVYINGDHELQGVATDWQNYGTKVDKVLLGSTHLPGPHRVAQDAIQTGRYDWCEVHCTNEAPYVIETARLHTLTLLVRTADAE